MMSAAGGASDVWRVPSPARGEIFIDLTIIFFASSLGSGITMSLLKELRSILTTGAINISLLTER